MSQVSDREQPSAQVYDKTSRLNDQDLTVALAMCAIGLAFSLVMLALPGWVS
jgi:hypothetical protein